jgi:hypothetical protein
MAQTVVDDALLRVDRIDPRIQGWLSGASRGDLQRLDNNAALDVPPEYLRFFEVMGGNADAIFGDVFTISIAGALEFYGAHRLSSRPLTSNRFLYLGSVNVGEPFPHQLFLQAHEPEQSYYGDFTGPRPIVRSDGHPEEYRVPLFTDLGEMILFQTWRFHRVRQYKYVGQVEVAGDENRPALDTFLQICASLGIQDAGLTTWCRCLEGPGQAVALHRRDANVPQKFTVNLGADEASKRAHLLELIADNLPSAGAILGAVRCR